MKNILEIKNNLKMNDEPRKENRYKCLKLLGEGSYGKAFLVECPDTVI